MSLLITSLTGIKKQTFYKLKIEDNKNRGAK